jgi:hypothetical protein
MIDTLRSIGFSFSSLNGGTGGANDRLSPSFIAGFGPMTTTFVWQGDVSATLCLRRHADTAATTDSRQCA